MAIATRRLEAGTAIQDDERIYVLDYTVLEGHRFAVQAIEAGASLLSWGLPFGIAMTPIHPGQYVHNADMLAALAERNVDFSLPPAPNFRNRIEPYVLDEAHFIPGRQVDLYDATRTFLGYVRPGGRGVGTRNYIVILGVTARTAGYARRLAEALAPLAAGHERVDGITALAHTEGDGAEPLNNREYLLRTLAGLMVHPNVGAVLAADYGAEPVNNDVLRSFMHDHGYPLEHVRHRFLRLGGTFEQDLAAGAAIVQAWLPRVDLDERAPVSAANLTIALQCGGSDAFSGVSGNPLAGAVAKEIIRYGGRANLAETDELIGAEPYMLQNMRDVTVARRFLQFIAEFKERVAWHGATAEGNPTGGNRYRGLYNIALKSIGAGMKRHPDVRLDYAVDYAEPMHEPGFYFMNTPGNDLESIAGQVAGGSNMIFFVTGNGSITNFPFVPTIKLVTTTPRFKMLAHEMDVNAGAYQDGRAMEELTAEMLDLTLRIASGEPSKGERAGHAQISIWRNWRQTDGSRLTAIRQAPAPAGKALTVRTDDLLTGQPTFQAVATDHGTVSRQVGLILPTSLCSGQIARLAAERLNQRGLAERAGLERFVALVHTEGCGVAMPTTRDVYNQTMASYMAHPMVRAGLFLEHGCEKTHNDYMRHLLIEQGMEPAAFGWASIQLDGGIEAVLAKIEAWFEQKLDASAPPPITTADLGRARVGLMNLDTVPSLAAARSLAQLVRTLVARGATVVIPHSAPLWQCPVFVSATVGARPAAPTLAYGQAITEPGLHSMAAPTRQWTETLTGLGATGVEVILAHERDPYAGHPFIPVLRMAESGPDLDLPLDGPSEAWAGMMLTRLADLLNRRYVPRTLVQQHVDFQLTRGLLGVST